MGERVTAGSLVYNVFEDQWKAQLGQGPDTRVPKDRFFLVRLSAVSYTHLDVYKRQALGSTAPVASRTVPVMEPLFWPYSGAVAARHAAMKAMANALVVRRCISDFLPLSASSDYLRFPNILI